jgi:hypothetical protein
MKEINQKIDFRLNKAINRSSAKTLKYYPIPAPVMQDIADNFAYLANDASDFKKFLRQSKIQSDTTLPEALNAEAQTQIKEEAAKFKKLFYGEISKYVCVVANSKKARHNLENLAAMLQTASDLKENSGLCVESTFDGKRQNTYANANQLVHAILEAAKYSNLVAKEAYNSRELERRNAISLVAFTGNIL